MKNISKVFSRIASGTIARRESITFQYSRKAGLVLQKLLEKKFISYYNMDFKGDKNRVWSVGLKYDLRR